MVFAGVCPSMNIPFIHGCKCLAAYLANESFLVTRKCSGTFRTTKLLFTSVKHRVYLQIIMSRKCLLTDSTCEWFLTGMSFHVMLQTFFPRGFEGAFRTSIRIFQEYEHSWYVFSNIYLKKTLSGMCCR